MEVKSQIHTPATLSQRKEPRYPYETRLDGTQSRPGSGGEYLFKIVKTNEQAPLKNKSVQIQPWDVLTQWKYIYARMKFYARIATTLCNLRRSKASLNNQRIDLNIPPAYLQLLTSVTYKLAGIMS